MRRGGEVGIGRGWRGGKGWGGEWMGKEGWGAEGGVERGGTVSLIRDLSLEMSGLYWIMIILVQHATAQHR